MRGICAGPSSRALRKPSPAPRSIRSQNQTGARAGMAAWIVVPALAAAMAAPLLARLVIALTAVPTPPKQARPAFTAPSLRAAGLWILFVSVSTLVCRGLCLALAFRHRAMRGCDLLETLAELVIRNLLLLSVGRTHDAMRSSTFLAQIVYVLMLYIPLFELAPDVSLKSTAVLNASVCLVALWSMVLLSTLFYVQLRTARACGQPFFISYVGVLVAVVSAHFMVPISGLASLHLHHVHWAWVVALCCPFPTSTSRAAQALAIAIHIHGAALYGFEPIFLPAGPDPTAAPAPAPVAPA